MFLPLVDMPSEHTPLGHIVRCFIIRSHPNGTVVLRGPPATDVYRGTVELFAVDWQGHQFHPDSQEKQE